MHIFSSWYNIYLKATSQIPHSLSFWIGFLRLFKCIAAHLVDRNIANSSRRLLALQGKYRGNRCFIMGNGPSLNLMDLGLLKQDYVWSTNKFYLLFEKINWRPSFYVAVDKRVVPDDSIAINNLISNLSETTFFFPIHFREQWILKSSQNVYWYKESGWDKSNYPDSTFTRDASNWVSSVKTVTIAALQLAVYLGFDPIYLIGCDTSYSLPSSVQFDKSNPDNLISTNDDDLNHFDPRYFGKGSKWHAPHVEKMLFHFKQAKQVCDVLGVDVYNATLGGKLEVFPRIDYNRLF